jgi:uncharacterized protein
MVVRFEWDAGKAARNLRKHGVSFDLARHVFADPLALSAPERIEGAEWRWQTIGCVAEHTLVLVVHTFHEIDDGGRHVEIIRLISARPADRKERQRYEEENRHA